MTLKVRIPSKDIQVVFLGNNKQELIFIKLTLIYFLFFLLFFNKVIISFIYIKIYLSQFYIVY